MSCVEDNRIVHSQIIWEHDNIAKKLSQGNKHDQSDNLKGFKQTHMKIKVNFKRLIRD